MEKYDTDVEEKTHQLEVLKASKASDLAKLQDLTKKVMPLESVLTPARFPLKYSSPATRKVRPCPNWRLLLQLRLGRARLPFFNTDRRADLAVAVANVANSDTALL